MDTARAAHLSAPAPTGIGSGATSATGIVVLRGGALGDCVATLPAIHSAAASWPGAGLCLLGATALRRLATPDLFVDHGSARLAPLYGSGALEPQLEQMLAAAELVLAYAPPGSSRELSRNLRAVCRGRLLLCDPHPPATGPHIVDHLLTPLRQSAIPTPVQQPRIDPTGSELQRGRTLLHDQRRAGRPLALLHPGSGGAGKRWPLERFQALAGALQSAGMRCAMVCGPVEEETGLPAAEGLPAGIPLIRQSSLADLIGLAAAADLFVGNDSGPAHVAAAVGTPTLALFGPTDPDLWRPLSPRARALRAPDGVLADLGVDSVHEAVSAMLSGETTA